MIMLSHIDLLKSLVPSLNLHSDDDNDVLACTGGARMQRKGFVDTLRSRLPTTAAAAASSSKPQQQQQQQKQTTTTSVGKSSEKAKKDKRSDADVSQTSAEDKLNEIIEMLDSDNINDDNLPNINILDIDKIEEVEFDGSVGIDVFDKNNPYDPSADIDPDLDKYMIDEYNDNDDENTDIEASGEI